MHRALAAKIVSGQGRDTQVKREPDIRPYRGKHPQIRGFGVHRPRRVIIGDVGSERTQVFGLVP